MRRDWIFFEIKCLDCGTMGELGIWTDKQDWGYRWSGFDGQAGIDGPHLMTVVCLCCFGRNVDVKRKN